MKKYLNLFKYEMKSLLKDALNLFMLFYPFFILIIIGVIIPLALEKVETNSSFLIIIILIMSLTLGSFLIGAMLGFSFVENKDEKTIISISVSPLKVEGYTTFKIIYSYLFSFIGNVVIIGGLKIIAKDAYIIEGNINLLTNITWLHVFVFSLVSSLFAPLIALIIASVAKNKIEAFALMKSSAIIIFIPILTLMPFFQGTKQYLLGLAPNFWTVKGMLNVALNNQTDNLGFYMYMLIGSIYCVLMIILAFKIFIKKQVVN